MRRMRYDAHIGFGGDCRGNVAITFGLAFLPALLMVGAAVDYSRATAKWTTLQQATDATALAAAHTYLNSTSTTAKLTPFAKTYINGLMNGATVTNVSLGQNNTQVCVQTTFDVPTMIMNIAGIKKVLVATTACSQVGATYEVALALDNSGSMSSSAGGQSKIAALKDAASKLITTLIPAGTTSPATAISIVPFTSMVNVGSNTGASFLDAAGASSIHWQNFHRPTGTSFRPTSKFDLFSTMNNASWGGCVEERPVPYTTSDTAASSSSPDTMFVPYLAPDEPGAVDSSGGYACYPLGSLLCGRSVPPYIFYNSYIGDSGSATISGACASSALYAAADTAAIFSGDNQTNVYPGSGMTMVCKYKGATPASVTSAVGLSTGPNFLCNSQQLTPLTTNTTVLNNAINSMVASGSTNLAAGFMWAWRTISPVVAPFTTSSTATIGQQNPKSYNYGPPPNTKVVILMTDGYNSWTSASSSPWGSLYEAFGYYKNNRIASYSSASSGVPGSTDCSGPTTTSSTYRCEMDNVTLEACARAKAAGVVVYTVAFSTTGDPIDAQGLALLQNCASSASDFFQASDSSSIVTAFQQIASSIQNLRLSR